MFRSIVDSRMESPTGLKEALLNKNGNNRQWFNAAYLEALASVDKRKCIPGSVKLNNKIIPVLSINLTIEDIKYFGIKFPPVDMVHKFRYLDYGSNEMIQLCFRMKRGRELILNLNPESPGVMEWLALINKTGYYGFHFYCVEKKLYVCSFTNASFDERAWLDRNYKRAQKLRVNNMEVILKAAFSTRTSKQRFYTGEKVDIGKAFISENSRLVLFERASEYIFS